MTPPDKLQQTVRLRIPIRLSSRRDVGGTEWMVIEREDGKLFSHGVGAFLAGADGICPISLQELPIRGWGAGYLVKFFGKFDHGTRDGEAGGCPSALGYPEPGHPQIRPLTPGGDDKPG